MTTMTASLERSLQKCSLNQTTGAGGGGRSNASNSSDYRNNLGGKQHHSNDNHQTVTATVSNASSSNSSNSYVELNSHISLPYHWEQCLDLKTGELYYINWSNMMKVREDPRTTTAGYNGDYDEDEEEDEEDEDDDDDGEDDEDEDDDDEEAVNNYVGYDSEGSSTESYRCSSSSRGNLRSSLKKLVMGGRRQNDEELKQESILVVAGCKSCLMYHMVPKHLEICPKCSGQLLHFPPNPNPNPTS